MNKTNVKYFSVLFILVIFSVSCNKDREFGGSKGADVKVKVSSISSGYNSLGVDVKSSSFNEMRTSKIVANGSVKLDDNMVLVAELVDVGNSQTKSVVEKPTNITTARVSTFYADQRKQPQANVLITESSKVFSVTTDGPSTLHFLALEDNSLTQELMYNQGNKSFEYTPNPDTRKDLFYATKEYTGNNIPNSEKLLFVPLFSKISSVKISDKTSNQWPILSVKNIKITGGIQEKYGKVTVSKDRVSYAMGENAQEKVIYSQEIAPQANATSIGNEGIFIPNDKNFSLSVDVKLKGKEYKTIKLQFNKSVGVGNNLMLNVKVRHNGITVIYVANTFQNGDKSIIFKELTTTKLDYNSTIPMPKQPEIDSDPEKKEYLSKFFDFARWCLIPYKAELTKQVLFKDQTQYKDPYSGNMLPLPEEKKHLLNETNFPDLATSDSAYIYAYWEPKLYRWNAEKPVNDPPAWYSPPNGKMATVPRFTILPSLNEILKYANGPRFFDSEFGDYKFQGVWLKKWITSDGAGSKETAPSNAYGYDITGTISNGDFSKTGYKKEDFFFLPFGGYYTAIEDLYYSPDNPNYCCTATRDYTVYFPCDCSIVYSNYILGGVLRIEQSRICVYGPHVNGYFNVVRAGFAIWPDDTYSK